MKESRDIKDVYTKTYKQHKDTCNARLLKPRPKYIKKMSDEDSLLAPAVLFDSKKD